MRYRKIIGMLIVLIVALAVVATVKGIFSSGGPGLFSVQSIRGKEVPIYGSGLYRDMSAEVAPQGIAQDYVTLFVAIPLLVMSFFFSGKGWKGRYLLAGTLFYFVVTYLFYTVMAMYNQMFLVYVLLMGASFYAFLLTIFSFDRLYIKQLFAGSTSTKWSGRFLLFISIAIALLWLDVVLPPLFDGTIIPVQVEHYTTLIVQGLDLGILLPGAFICGILFIKKRSTGYLLAPVYLVFLSLLMLALTAKLIVMYAAGFNVVPAIFIIPVFAVLSITAMISILRNIREKFIYIDHCETYPPKERA
jgi:hypothetical protein